MKPDNLQELNSLSNLDGKDSSLIVQSTRMDLETNTYISELWKRDKNLWKKYKSGNFNFSNPRFSKLSNSIFYIKTPRESKNNGAKVSSTIQVQSGKSIETLFVTEGKITNYVLSKNEKFIYVVTNEWSKDFKNIEEKEEEPLYYENLPFRFDSVGIIYNKRSHVYKVNLQSKKSTTVVNGDKENILSIDSLVEHKNLITLSYSKYNSAGTMLEESIGTVKNRTIYDIFKKGSISNLFYYKDTLHGVGLKSRFDWPTNPTILKFSKSGNPSFKFKLFDRNISKAKVHNSVLYFLYEDSGKTLLHDGTNNVDLVNLDITIKDFAFNGNKIYVIANSFSKPDEIYELENGQINKTSKANDYFVNKIKTHDCVYKRIDTGESEIDTWGIFVGKDRPTILNIHGGPASQYGFTFFDEFQTYATAGFNVIACNPRGSSGRGHDFLRDVCGNKWGVNDLHDVITAFRKMLKIMDVGNKNYGIMGGSYGGFMTSWIVSHKPNIFKSAVVERALLNWETMVGTSDIGIGFPEMYLLEDMSKNKDFYRQKSPITYASNIKTPTLILHSEEDYRCPVEQAEQLFSNLKKRGIDTAMLRFPGESHELSRSGKPKHRKQRFDHIIRWLSLIHI